MSIKGKILFELLKKWGVDHARSRNHSETTIRTNIKFSSLYFRYLNGKEHNPDSCNQFLADGRNGKVTKIHWKNESIRTRAIKLRAFTNWLFLYEEIIEKNWSHRIIKPPETKMEYDVISTKRWRELIFEMTEILPHHNKRDIKSRIERRFYLLTLLLMAVRGKEPFSITSSDINLDNEIPYVWVNGKGKNGGTRRRVLIHPELVPEFAKRKNWEKIFTTSQETCQDAVRKIRKKYNLPKNLSLHKMRHENGTEMIDNGATLMQVAEALGHSNTKMVERYYYKGSLKSKEAALKAFNPSWASSNSNEEYIKHLLSLLRRGGILDNPHVAVDYQREGDELLLHARPKT